MKNQCDIIGCHNLSVNEGQPSFWCLVAQHVEAISRRRQHTHFCGHQEQANLSGKKFAATVGLHLIDSIGAADNLRGAGR
jgi:hypothetical protein